MKLTTAQTARRRVIRQRERNSELNTERACVSGNSNLRCIQELSKDKNKPEK